MPQENGLSLNPLLNGVHPDLIIKSELICQAMAILGFPMKVVQGLRSATQQQILWAQGRTTPGPIVTNCDGIIKRSNHQSHNDSLGHALDLAFCGPDPFAETHPWSLFGAMVVALGLNWGGSPGFIKAGLLDRPHMELP